MPLRPEALAVRPTAGEAGVRPPAAPRAAPGGEVGSVTVDAAWMRALPAPGPAGEGGTRLVALLVRADSGRAPGLTVLEEAPAATREEGLRRLLVLEGGSLADPGLPFIWATRGRVLPEAEDLAVAAGDSPWCERALAGPRLQGQATHVGGSV